MKVIRGTISKFLCRIGHLILLSVVFSAFTGLAEARILPPFTVGGDHDYAPFELLDDRGNAAGFNVALMRAIAETMGFNVDFQLGSWETCVQAFREGTIDILPMFPSEARATFAAFTDPHIIVYHRIFVRTGAGPYKELSDISGREVIVQQNAYAHEHLLQQFENVTLIPVETESEALRLLASGEHDCALITHIGGRQAIQRHGLRNVVSGSPPLLPCEYSFAVTKDNPGLLSMLNQGLRIIQADGRYDAVYDQWLGDVAPRQQSFRELFKQSLWFVGPLLFGAILILLLSLPLQRPVAHYQIAAAYVIAGSLWILVTDALVAHFFVDAKHIAWAQLAKGWLYVVGTGVIFGVILRRYLFRIASAMRSLERGNLALARTTRVFQVLSECNQALVRSENPERLLTEVCKKLVESGGYGLAWVRFSTGRETNAPHIGAFYCAKRLGLDAPPKFSQEDLQGQDSVKRALDANGPVVLTDIHAEPAFQDWTADGVAAQLRTAVILPLSCDDFGMGYLCICSEKQGVFDAAEIKLLCELRDDILFGLRAFAVDSERGSLEEQLRQAQKMEAIGRLAGSIAHDFNNLLSVINGFADLALAELRVGDRFHDELSEIRQAGDRGATLIRQLLTFSRKQLSQPKLIQPNAVLMELRKILQRLVSDNVEVVMTLADDIGHVKVDPHQLDQVVMNLVINGNDAMPEGGRLCIETRNVVLDETYQARHARVAAGRYVLLSVSDTGIGIAPDVLPEIFEPFFTTKEPGKGTGLGLSTVYDIVKQHGGDIQVYSEEQLGTTFKIYLPRVDAHQEELPTANIDKTTEGTETVLVIEDEPSVRIMACRILESAGYKVYSACDGEEALRLCEQQLPTLQLLLTDVVMPGMTGRETAEQLKQLYPGLKILYMSGFADDAILRHTILEQSAAFIGKPFTIIELTEKVRAILDGQ